MKTSGNAETVSLREGKMNILADISGVKLETERLILREWKESDLDDFYEYASVDGVGQMAGWQPHENIEKSREILDSFINGKHTFCIEYEGKAIGSLGLEKYAENAFSELSDMRGTELGFVLSKDFWGQGLMPEAVNAAADYCFGTLGADFLLCGYFPANTRSARIQAKCGFRYYKTLKQICRSGETRIVVMNVLFGKEKAL